MKALGIIPARFGSTRFPGKPLATIHGKTMIQRVYKRARMSSMLEEVIIATDDQRIYEHVISFGGKAVMTSSNHLSGTDRCAEAMHLAGEEYDVIVNIQGDEPFINPEQINLLVNCFTSLEVEIATLVKKITNPADLENVNLPKVVVQKNGYALYFSRNQVPYCKPENVRTLLDEDVFFKHVGIYGYRYDILRKLAALPTGKLENCESLEQLRWLENGFRIMTAVTDHENIAVDVPGDITLIESRFTAAD